MFALGAVGYAALEASLARTHSLEPMALTGVRFWSVCGSCGGAYTGKSAPRCLAGASHRRNMWSAPRSTGDSGCACGIARMNSATFRTDLCEIRGRCGLLSTPIMLPEIEDPEMCTSRLAIQFSNRLIIVVTQPRRDTPCQSPVNAGNSRVLLGGWGGRTVFCLLAAEPCKLTLADDYAYQAAAGAFAVRCGHCRITAVLSARSFEHGQRARGCAAPARHPRYHRCRAAIKTGLSTSRSSSRGGCRLGPA